MLIGVVGKPNVGKSTLFKSMTLADAYIANYPFATIKPNTGVGYVKVECADKFFNVQCNPRVGFCTDHNRFVPIEIIDVAGLVPGAHEGKGMGNQFLDDLNQADALIHCIDLSGGTNEEGKPVPVGSYNPSNDILFLEKELDYWYLRILKKGWEKFSREMAQGKEKIQVALAKRLAGVGVKEAMVDISLKRLGLDIIQITKWQESDLFNLSSELRKTSKPMVIACNKMDIPGSMETFQRLKKEFPNHKLTSCSAEAELALKEAQKKGLISYLPGDKDFSISPDASLTDKQRAALEFIRESVLKSYGSTGVQEVIDVAVFDILKLIPIFPGGMSKLADSDGNVLPDCFLLPDGSTALDFAYKIHTDLGDTFIRAADVKKRLTVGKEYALKPGDVIEIYAGK